MFEVFRPIGAEMLRPKILPIDALLLPAGMRLLVVGDQSRVPMRACFSSAWSAHIPSRRAWNSDVR